MIERSHVHSGPVAYNFAPLAAAAVAVADRAFADTSDSNSRPDDPASCPVQNRPVPPDPQDSDPCPYSLSLHPSSILALALACLWQRNREAQSWWLIVFVRDPTCPDLVFAAARALADCQSYRKQRWDRVRRWMREKRWMLMWMRVRRGRSSVRRPGGFDHCFFS
jgi:hypothetical protein